MIMKLFINLETVVYIVYFHNAENVNQSFANAYCIVNGKEHNYGS